MVTNEKGAGAMHSQLAALVQTRFEPVDPEVIDRTLTRLTKFPRAEIMRIAKRERGILCEHFPPQLADVVAQSFAAENVGVACVPASELPQLSKPRNALWIEPNEIGFGVPLDHRQVLEPINWLSVFVIHAELLADPHATSDLKPPSQDTAWGRMATVEPPKTKITQRFPNLDVVAIADSGKLVYFRLAQSRFAPGRMPWIKSEQSLAEKFHQILRLLVERSPEAIVSPDARALMATQQGSQHSLANTGAEERDERATANYMRWLLWLAMHRERVANT
jgi:hypothetical protein